MKVNTKTVSDRITILEAHQQLAINEEFQLNAFRKLLELEAQVNALAAENLALKNAIKNAEEDLQEHYDTQGVDSEDQEGNFSDACIRLCDAKATVEKLKNIGTPATDAIKRQWMAEGALRVASKITSKISEKGEPNSHYAYAYVAVNLADQLRQPEEKAE